MGKMVVMYLTTLAAVTFPVFLHSHIYCSGLLSCYYDLDCIFTVTSGTWFIVRTMLLFCRYLIWYTFFHYRWSTNVYNILSDSMFFGATLY